MTAIYFDSSAFVKLLVSERGSDLARELWDRADSVVVSRLGIPEVAAALAAAERGGRLDARQHRTALAEWTVAREGLELVDLSDNLADTASHLAARHSLSGADAVHLASALELGDGALIAVWDARLRQGARSEGLRVLPDRLD